MMSFDDDGSLPRVHHRNPRRRMAPMHQKRIKPDGSPPIDDDSLPPIDSVRKAEFGQVCRIGNTAASDYEVNNLKLVGSR